MEQLLLLIFFKVKLLSKNQRLLFKKVSNGKTNTLNTACNYGVVVNDSIRELNIVEYERLQTLPDNYTQGVSDNQRKKMIGNGWTVDVISYIFSHIIFEKSENLVDFQKHYNRVSDFVSNSNRTHFSLGFDSLAYTNQA